VIALSKKLAVLVSSGFGSGYSPKAPGTVGSAAALASWYTLKSFAPDLNSLADAALAVLLMLIGLIAVIAVVGRGSSEDPQWIVIDEWAGLYLALIGVSHHQIGAVILGFVCFRIFDATKLGPVGRAEDLPGAWGIMADDVVAGVMAACVVRLYLCL
jgi:phosphatidylglycerophosphatase A